MTRGVYGCHFTHYALQDHGRESISIYGYGKVWVEESVGVTALAFLESLEAFWNDLGNGPVD